MYSDNMKEQKNLKRGGAFFFFHRIFFLIKNSKISNMSTQAASIKALNEFAIEMKAQMAGMSKMLTENSVAVTQIQACITDQNTAIETLKVSVNV